MKNLMMILPLTIVMVTGPQIIAAIFLTMSKNRLQLTTYYILGSILGICTVVGIVFLTGFGLPSQIQTPDIINKLIIFLLVLVMIASFANRNKPKDTKDDHESTSNRKVFIAGFVLLGFFPTDFLTNLAVGSSLYQQEQKIAYFIAFLFLTIFLLSSPLLIVTVAGKAADPILNAIRRSIDRYSWVLAELICLAIIASIIRA